VVATTVEPMMANSSATVFISGLAPWVGSTQLRQWLSEESIGYLQVTVLKDRGIAFVTAPNQGETDRIISRYHMAPLDGNILHARPARPPKSARAGAR
jgi:hypothetical protein